VTSDVFLQLHLTPRALKHTHRQVSTFRLMILQPTPYLHGGIWGRSMTMISRSFTPLKQLNHHANEKLDIKNMFAGIFL
jgi:hypothetical protein